MTRGIWEKNGFGLEREYEGEGISNIKCPHCGDAEWYKREFGEWKPFYKCHGCGFDFVITSKRGSKTKAYSVVR